jgi:hypothetical protein
MRKQIFTALIRRDKAKTFGVIEPLHRTGRHCKTHPSKRLQNIPIE